MERRGWLEAEWGESELGRRAKLYRLTRRVARNSTAETAAWRQFAAGVSKTPVGRGELCELRSSGSRHPSTSVTSVLDE